MKIINRSTASEHIVISGQEFNKVTILASNCIKYSTVDRRVTAPLYGEYNIAEIYRCYSQMGINDIEFIIDSKQLRELSSFVMIDNFKADKKRVIDIATGVDYSKYSAFQYLWRAYTLNPTGGASLIHIKISSPTASAST